jgi:hypothetical protein
MALVQCHFDCVSGVNKTVKKELHVMQNKIIRFITGFDRANAREWKADFTLKGIVNDNVQMINPATKSNDCRAYAFYASRIVEHSRSYMNLYDQYRIKMVTIEIDVWSNGKKGMLLLKTDVDDNDAIDYDKLILDPKTCKYNMDLDGKTVLWRCYPKAQVNIYQTSSSKDAHGPANRFQWIDCSNSDVQYYGVKVALTDYMEGARMQLCMHYVIEYKNRKGSFCLINIKNYMFYCYLFALIFTCLIKNTKAGKEHQGRVKNTKALYI